MSRAKLLHKRMRVALVFMGNDSKKLMMLIHLPQFAYSQRSKTFFVRLVFQKNVQQFRLYFERSETSHSKTSIRFPRNAAFDMGHIILKGLEWKNHVNLGADSHELQLLCGQYKFDNIYDDPTLLPH